MRQEIYASDTLHIFARRPQASRKLVITFQSLNDTPYKQGFGEEFLDNIGLDAIHVLPKSNRWYQYPDIPEALAAIKAATTGHEEIITYGLSMGAYAATNFAGDLGAHRVIAISPQFSLNHALVPFEHRWDSYIAGLSFPYDRIAQTDAKPHTVHAIYDPHNQDAHHIALIAQHLPIDPIRIPYSGHPPTDLLLEANLLSTLITDLLHNRLNRPHFAQTLRTAARQTGTYHAGLAEALSWSKPRLKIALLQKAVTLAPTNRALPRALITTHLVLGQSAAALTLLEAERKLDPTYPFLPFFMSQAYEGLGRHDEALAAATEAESLNPGFPTFVERIAYLRAARIAADAAHARANRSWLMRLFRK